VAGRVPLLVDCDPGCDDAVALWLALGSPGLAVTCITIVAGNVAAARCAANARRVLDFAGRDVPVLLGAERDVPDAVVHGADGLAGLDLPPASRGPDPGDAVAAILAARRVVAIGPLSNLAATLARDPRWRPETLVWMGGAVGPGNVTPTAEFNAHCDPPAVRAVLAAGFDPIVVPWDAALMALSTDARLDALHGRVGMAAARMLREYRRFDMQRYGTPGGALPDPLAIALLTDPHLFRIEPRSVAVAPDGTTRFGPPGAGPPVRLVTGVDADGVYRLLAERLAAL
jgi:inosine-uridine nucleoside N-ribohydrolase